MRYSKPFLKMTLTLFFSSIALFQQAVYAESPREQLAQMVGQLQKTPNDDALRERVIKLAQTLKPAPAIPEEARRHMARGMAAFETAKTAHEFANASIEFDAARDIAPWWADPYFNNVVAAERMSAAWEGYAVLQESVLKEAMQSIRWYLLAAPNATDAEAMRTKLYKFEYLAEQKGKEQDEKNRRAGWAASIVRQLNAFYGSGQIISEKNCDGPTSNHIQLGDGAYVPRCNEHDANGKNWDNRLGGGTISFAQSASDASKVEMHVKDWWTFFAQPTGPNPDTDIPSWSCVNGKVNQMCKGSVRAEFGMSDGNPRLWLTGSCDGDNCIRWSYTLKK